MSSPDSYLLKGLKIMLNIGASSDQLNLLDFTFHRFTSMIFPHAKVGLITYRPTLTLIITTDIKLIHTSMQ